MVKRYGCAGILLFAMGLFPLLAQDNAAAKEMAIKIADRIVASTVYEFKDVKTGKVYTSLDNVSLNPDMRVNSKYLNWHYTNGVTNMALMELGDKIQNRKYEDYVLKNMKFIFDKTNQSYFHRLYDKTFREGGWRAVPRLTWHMIYRNKRLDDNGPMGASLITLNQRHPDDAFQKYIETTNHHIMVSEPRLADGTIARLWPHENTIWADDAFMAVSFISRMGEITGEKKYFDDAANQILNYTRYLWCPEKQIYYHCYHTDNKEHGVAHWSRANGWIFMATADLLARMPENHPMREDVIKNFQMQASGVARYQGKNGLWHQLLDKEDSYEEITGSSMFVFGIAKGVKEGWLHPDFIYVAWQGFKGMLSKISENGDVTAICVGTGIMPSTVFYYNPNIYPQAEYDIRKAEAIRYVKALGLDFIDGDYDYQLWRSSMSGMEDEPERGSRCLQCFTLRLTETARYAAEHGFTLFTTTLASSRWKSLDQINLAGRRAAALYPGTIFWEQNWRKGGLQDRRNQLLKEHDFYNQQYCGCEFSMRRLEEKE